MTESEHAEHMNLIDLWNCTEPMTPAQIARMEELDALSPAQKAAEVAP